MAAMHHTESTKVEVSAFSVTITKTREGDPETFRCCHHQTSAGKGGADFGPTVAAIIQQAVAQIAALQASAPEAPEGNDDDPQV